MDLLFEQILEVLQAGNLVTMFLATIAGLLIGVMPGLTVNMAVALAVPLTMHMGMVPSLCMLFALYASGIYGGSVSAILINAPGTPASVATALDGYPLAQQGKAGKALKMALVASLTGGVFSVVVLVLVAGRLASVALLFGPAEKTTLLLFALTMVGLLSGDSMLKGLMAGSLGLLLSTVGLDPMLAVPRFTFGSAELEDGLSFVPVLVGLFAVSEILFQAGTRMRATVGTNSRVEAQASDSQLTGAEVLRSWKTLLRSSFLGTFIGILPGIGATVASLLAYGEAKRRSRSPELFGKGALEGVAASEAANNAVTGATLIPLLALSIPGDAVTAILYGALLMQGVTPGPLIFQTKLNVVYQIYVTLILANIFMLGVGFSFLTVLKHVAKAPARILFPTIFVFCVLGSLSIRNSLFDVFVMLAFGLLGFGLRQCSIPLAPLLIAFILGPLLEEALRQALVSSEGSVLIFLVKPLAALFLALTVVSIVFMVRRALPFGPSLKHSER